MITTSHMGLFNFKLIKVILKLSSSVTQATFPMLSSHMWLVVIILDNTDDYRLDKTLWAYNWIKYLKLVLVDIKD